MNEFKKFLKGLQTEEREWQPIDAHIITGKDNKSYRTEKCAKGLDPRFDWVYIDDIPMEYGEYNIFSNNGAIFAYKHWDIENTWVEVPTPVAENA